jgi:hypothetical protein
VAVTLAIAFVTVVVGAATIGDNLHIGTDNGRQRLSPIAVSIDACPYLRPVHEVAGRLGNQWAGSWEPWPSFRARLAADLPKLEAALKRAEPHVPARIVSKFEVVALEVHLGRTELPRARSPVDVLFPPGVTKSPVLEGVDALADASDLVGNVCGYRLAPSRGVSVRIDRK